MKNRLKTTDTVNKSKLTAVVLAAIWLFNPLTFYNSAIWGQTDTIVNFLGLTSIYYLFNKKVSRFTFFLSLSLLFKGSLLIFVPLLFVLIIMQGHSSATFVKAAIVGILITLITSFWFHPSFNLPIWLLNLYSSRILPGEIGYLTANAFNFWWLIDSGKVLDSTLFLSLAFRVWGFIIFAFISIVIIFRTIRAYSEKRVIFALALVAFSSFLFITRMHERYLFPLFPLATILLFYYPRLVLPYFVLSVVFLVNMFNLFWVPTIEPLRFVLGIDTVPIVLSLLNIIVFTVLLAYFLLSSDSQKAR